jgi:predicted metalloprotease with PDZ domain
VNISRVPRICFFAFSLVICVCSLGARTEGAIRYEISLAHPERHVFHVTMTIPDVKDQVTIQMPAWNALYQIRDFSAHVRRVEAAVGANSSGDLGKDAASRPASIEKIDKQTWRIAARGRVTAQYDIYWDEPGPFATQLNQEHAFINPAMILMYVPDRRSEQVKVSLPDVPELWSATGPGIQGVEHMGGARDFFSEFANYDALADAPIEAGKFEQFQLEGIKPAIWVVVHGDNWRKKQLENDLKRICEYELRLMGDVPFPRYTFLLHIGKGAAGAGGGMEHSDSTAISTFSDESLQNVAAHEFFHLWNVKRIRPASLVPVDYTKEKYTRALWFAEGVTNTYAAYTLARSSIWSKQQFYQDFAEQITEIESRPANHWQSAEQSSLDAWLEKYPLYERAEHSVSYYTKGQILGVLLDILIRDRTNNEKSLDDVLRAMNREFALTGKPYRDSLDVQLTVEKIAGGSFGDFFKHYVAGADPLPYRATLQLAGLDLRPAERKRPTLGFAADIAPGGPMTARTVEANSPAAQAGLQAGDIIVNWNRTDPPRRPEQWLRQQKPGALVHLRIRRDETEMNVDFHLGEVAEVFYDVVEDSHAGEKARHIRDGLLHGVTGAAAAAP